jgi:ribosome-associated protein
MHLVGQYSMHFYTQHSYYQKTEHLMTTSPQTIEFELRNEYVELCNLLKLVGLADSGGRGKVMVAEGLVKVDGVLETRKTAKIRAGQIVESRDTHIRVVSPIPT